MQLPKTTIRLTEPVRRLLTDYAQQRGMPLSAAINHILWEYLTKHK